MVWRGSNTLQDRIFACLVYIVPVLELLLHGFASPLFRMLPFLEYLFLPFIVILPIYDFNYRGIAIVWYAVFIGLFIGVGRSSKLGHFLRFHMGQVLILSVIVFLCSAVIGLLGFSRAIVGIPNSFAEGLFWQSIATLIFVTVFGAVVYSIIQAARGLYAEMPVISNAVYRFVR